MTRDEALKKIKKCLALGRSASEHEAAAALRQAQKLMDQFGLREQDVSLADVHEVKARTCCAGVNAWEVRLVAIIALAFGCEYFRQQSGEFSPTTGAYVRRRDWVFVGLDSAPTVAGYAFEVLGRQCARARMEHIRKQPRNCKPATKTQRGDLFAGGWVLGVERLVERVARPESDKQLLLTYMTQHHGDMEKAKVRHAQPSRDKDYGHIAAGRQAGRNAQLHRGVGGMAEQQLLT